MKARNFLWFFYLNYMIASTSFAATMDTRVIEQEVQAFLQQYIESQLPPEDKNDVKITLRPIDTRLRLSQCDIPLTLNLQGKGIQRNVSVKVSCRNQRPWSLYASATLSMQKNVISVRHGLPRHHIVTESDITTIRQDVYNLRTGYNIREDDVLGMQLKRALRSGEVIYSYQLKAPDIIKKGDLVTVVAKRGSLSVMSPGIALNDASKGEKLRVENQRSSRIVHTRATGPGTVEVL